MLLTMAFRILRKILKGSQIIYRNHLIEAVCEDPFKSFLATSQEKNFMPPVERPNRKNLLPQCKGLWKVWNWKTNPGREMMQTKLHSFSLHQSYLVFSLCQYYLKKNLNDHNQASLHTRLQFPGDFNGASVLLSLKCVDFIIRLLF